MQRLGDAPISATLVPINGSGRIDVSNPSTPDGDETRAGFRSGEGVESVMRHMIASARRRQKRKGEGPDSGPPSRWPDDSEGGVDIALPP